MLKTKAGGRLATLVVVVLTTIGTLAAPLAAQEPAPPAEAHGEPNHGQAAIDQLGDRLPVVAARHGMTAGRLRMLFQTDETLWVDAGDALFYVDPAIETHGSESGSDPVAAAAAPFPLSQTFALHSRTSSTLKIFLDFDGHSVTGTGFNLLPAFGSQPTIVGDPYDTDGQPLSFADQEREAIQDVWRRVAEDFAAFDVDVTTEDPGDAGINKADAGDLSFGTRVLIDGGTSASTCGCGGYAYIGVYDLAGPDHDYYQPAWVFQAGGLDEPKELAEAASHEAGHNLGLNHDGRTTPSEGYYYGHGAWAPIMGVGYDRPVTQWSKGEYASANNTEDDLQLITDNGLPRVTDSIGDVADNSAPDLTGTASVVSATGAIETGTDADVFEFTAPAGLVTIDADPAAVSPNLDLSMQLLDSTGSPVAATADSAAAFVSDDVASGLDAQIQEILPAGTYYARIEGVGVGTASTGYTDYASLGEYTVSAAFGPCAVDDDLADDDTLTTQVLVPGQAASGKRCADDDYMRVPGFNTATLTANLTASDADLSLDILDSAGAQLATVAVPSGTTQPLEFPFTANADHFLRVRGAAGVESRYSITTSMPACPPLDQHEAGANGDDFPSTGTLLSFPGTKDGISCSGDPNNGDFVRIPAVAGREITATVQYPSAAGTFAFHITRFAASNQTIVAGVTVTDAGGLRQLRYTPTVTGTHELWVQWLSGAIPYRLTVSQAAEVAPTITDVSPSAAHVGDEVVITGTNFGTVTEVAFTDGVSAAFTIDSLTQITATVPVGAASGPITVTNGAGSAQTAFTLVGDTWGTAGTVTRNGPADDVVRAIATAPDGTVYAAWEDGPTTDGTAIVRYREDGTPDTSFGGGDGEVTFAQGVLGYVDDLSVDSQNRLLIIGQWSTGDPFDPPNYDDGNRLYRLEADGDLDATFSGDGIVDFGPVEDADFGLAYQVQVDASDRVLVSGDASVPVPLSFGDSKVFLLRYTTAGAPDSSFGGGDGAVLTDLTTNTQAIYTVGDLRVDASDKIWLFASYQLDFADPVVSVLRYGDSGALDTTYNADGRAEYACPGNDLGFVYGGNVLPDGRAVILANCDMGGSAPGARGLRLTATGALDTSYGIGGVRVYSASDGSKLAVGENSQVGPDGAVYLHGFDGQDEYIGRISPNGAIDPAYERTVAHDDGYAMTAALDELGAFFYGYTQSGAGKVTRLDPVTGEPPNNPPVAADDAATVFEADGTSVIYVLGNDSDADDDLLTITAETQGTNGGTVDCVSYGDSCDFTPAAGTTSDEFTYTVSDGVASDTATVTVTVEPAAPQPNVWLDEPCYALGSPSVIKGMFTFEATASGTAIDSVEFFVDGTSVGMGVQQDAELWSLNWSSAPVGDGQSHEVSVVATATSGLSAQDSCTTQILSNAVADFDGDGTTDIAVYRNGAWLVRDQTTIYHGLATDIPVPGDYDGDGTTDRAVFRPANGGWYIHGQPTIYHGLNGDIPVPGDYDGNGTTDIAVYRDGAWLIREQTTVYLGVGSDVPVPGDYDGDGTTDPAVYRDGAWYINGQPTTYHGLAGDIPTPKRPAAA